MKKFLYFGLIFVLVALIATEWVVFHWQKDDPNTSKTYFSRDRQWLLSGQQHLFDVTDRTFDLVGLFGTAEGVKEWAPIGGEKTAYYPTFIPAARSMVSKEDEYVLGVLSGDTATAYPLRILAEHQIVNDTTQTPGVLVYFGNISRTAVAYRSTSGGEDLSFGCSGYLDRNTDLLFDTQSESLFSPLTGVFCAGERLGERLEMLPTAIVPMETWMALFPDSRMLSTNTGVTGAAYPYKEVLYAPLELKAVPRGAAVEAAFDTEAPVIAAGEGWDTVIVPFPSASQAGKTEVEVTASGKALTVHFTEDFRAAYVTDENDRLAPSIRSVWNVYRGVFDESEVAKVK